MKNFKNMSLEKLLKTNELKRLLKYVKQLETGNSDLLNAVHFLHKNK